MATVKAFIRTSTKKVNSANVRFRLSDGRSTQLFHVSENVINPNDWDAKNERIKVKILYDEEKRNEFNRFITDRKNLILEIYNQTTVKESLTSNWLEAEIEKKLHPEKYNLTNKEKSFFDYYDDWMVEYNGTARTKQHYKAVGRILKRFELYTQKQSPQFLITLDNLTPDTLRQLEKFIIEEHMLFEIHKDIYEAVPDSRPPKKRGQNRINKIFRYIRTFYIWAIKNEITSNNPFERFKIKADLYGTPYYLTLEEVHKLYEYNFLDNPELAKQKDIFVFHCMIGCRIGDLIKLKKNNIINNAIEYIPRKTKEGRPVIVRVPLNKITKEIIERYNDEKSEKLLPFLYEQGYNYAIKDILKLAGITRMVTVINPLTREEEKRPINEVASSHIARKTFIGNLYKRVQDPNLIGSLSGHKEGSRAFSRYREIDEEIKTELVKIFEK